MTGFLAVRQRLRQCTCRIFCAASAQRVYQVHSFGSLLPFAAFANKIIVKSESERRLCGLSGR
jgi:hypothetical protein